MRSIVIVLMLVTAATTAQEVPRRYRYIPPRYEDYEDIEASPLSPTLNNALPSPAPTRDSSSTQRPESQPDPRPPDVGQPEAPETPDISENPVLSPQDQGQGSVVDQSQGQGINQAPGQGQGSNLGQGQGSNFGQGQGTDFGQGQGSNFGQGQGSNFGQAPEVNQGSNFGQGQGSDLNQGQSPDFNKGQEPGTGFQSVVPAPSPIPIPVPQPEPQPELQPQPQPQPLPQPQPPPRPQPNFTGHKPVHPPSHGHEYTRPCGGFGCWGTQQVYPWGSWDHAAAHQHPHAMPYYPQFGYHDRQAKRYPPPKFW